LSFDLSFERDEVYECGAVLLTVLALPKQVAEEKSSQLYRSLCGKALWLTHVAAPNDLTPIMVKPQYVFRDRKIIDRDVRIVEKRLGERMVAGRMAIPFLQRSALGVAGPLPDGVQRLSLNQIAEFVLEDAGQADAINVERRYWSPSRPVIHLAAAAAMVGQQRRKSGQIIGLESFLFDRALIEEIVRGAEEFAGLIDKDPKFPVKAEQLIRFGLS
jgi:hypothetical protein